MKMPELSSDDQAPIVPPTVMVASNQKIQIGMLFTAGRSLWEEWRQTIGESRRACSHKLHDR
jgi:hypothetical protein